MPEELLLSSASEELLLDRRIIPWHLGGGDATDQENITFTAK